MSIIIFFFIIHVVNISSMSHFALISSSFFMNILNDYYHHYHYHYQQHAIITIITIINTFSIYLTKNTAVHVISTWSNLAQNDKRRVKTKTKVHKKKFSPSNILSALLGLGASKNPSEAISSRMGVDLRAAGVQAAAGEFRGQPRTTLVFLHRREGVQI